MSLIFIITSHAQGFEKVLSTHYSITSLSESQRSLLHLHYCSETIPTKVPSSLNAELNEPLTHYPHESESLDTFAHFLFPETFFHSLLHCS